MGDVKKENDKNAELPNTRELDNRYHSIEKKIIKFREQAS